MCGLTGFIQPTAFVRSGQAESAIRQMAGVITHRGPDSSGYWLSPDSSEHAGGVTLGHRRLSILDLSPAGHQPMHSACGRYVIAFNGEIYNHLALRKQLEAAGHIQSPWRGHSDTETLLAAFSAWGVVPTLKAAVGMFAIALWDSAQQSVFLARDRFGEKPLYYGFAQGQGGEQGEVAGRGPLGYRKFKRPISRFQAVSTGPPSRSLASI